MKKDKNTYVNNNQETNSSRGKNRPDVGFIYLIKNPSSNELSVCASEVPLKRGTAVIASCRYGLDYGVVVGSAVALSAYEPGSTEISGSCLHARPSSETFDPDEDLVAWADFTETEAKAETDDSETADSETVATLEPEETEVVRLENLDPPYVSVGITYNEVADSACDACGCCGKKTQESRPEVEVELDGDVDWIERLATEEDKRKFREYVQMEDDALRLCREKVQKHNLDMKLVTAHYLFGEPKILFFFTAANRVDFRDLVKDLVAVFRIRIELRQIGVRDESRVLGGLAVCGRDYCCHCVTDKLNPVSIKMAKEQNLSLNSTKISGPCGRLLCCLSYEYDFYVEEKQNLPSEGSRMKVLRDLMKITEVNILTKKISLVGPEGRYLTIPFSAVFYNDDTSHWEIAKEYLDEFLSN